MCVCVRERKSEGEREKVSIATSRPYLPSRRCRRQGPGTNPGTDTAYRPTALPTVGPYALPVLGFVPDPDPPAVTAVQAYLTQCINQMVLESQLPHKNVNILF